MGIRKPYFTWRSRLNYFRQRCTLSQYSWVQLRPYGNFYMHPYTHKRFRTLNWWHFGTGLGSGEIRSQRNRHFILWTWSLETLGSLNSVKRRQKESDSPDRSLRSSSSKLTIKISLSKTVQLLDRRLVLPTNRLVLGDQKLTWSPDLPTVHWCTSTTCFTVRLLTSRLSTLV